MNLMDRKDFTTVIETVLNISDVRENVGQHIPDPGQATVHIYQQDVDFQSRSPSTEAILTLMFGPNVKENTAISCGSSIAQ
jgi:hypothetical protein